MTTPTTSPATPALPAATSAERSVLGALLVNGDAMNELAGLLEPEHFFDPLHAQLYGACLSCFQQQIPLDLSTLAEELRRRGQLDSLGGFTGFASLVATLLNGAALPSHMHYYARDVLAAATRRRIITTAMQIAGLAYQETEDVQILLARAHDMLDVTSSTMHDPRYQPFTAAELEQEEQPELLWVVPGLICAGLTLLVGKPKMRKSWLMLALALAIASGGRALGSIPVDTGDALYLALEDGKRRLQSRQRKLLQGAAAPSRLTYLTAAPRLDQGCVGLVESWLRAHPGARMIIVDVLAKVRPKSRGGNMYDEDYTALESLQQLALRRNIAVIVVHHMNRSNAEDVYDLVNGSNGIGGAVDALLGLQYERGSTDATLSISGREIEDETSLALHWDQTTAQWVLIGAAEEVKVGRERQAIMRVLRDEKRPMGPKEVAEALGKQIHDYANIKQLLYRMAKDGDLKAVDRGKYTVPSLTLLADDNEKGDRGDPNPITFDESAEDAAERIRTPSVGNYLCQGDRGDPARITLTDCVIGHQEANKNVKVIGKYNMCTCADDEKCTKCDHLDHLPDQDALKRPKKGDPTPDHLDHLDHLDIINSTRHGVRQLPDEERTLLRMRLRSNRNEDQEIARFRCAAYGIDYETALAWAHQQR